MPACLHPPSCRFFRPILRCRRNQRDRAVSERPDVSLLERVDTSDRKRGTTRCTDTSRTHLFMPPCLSLPLRRVQCTLLTPNACGGGIQGPLSCMHTSLPLLQRGEYFGRIWHCSASRKWLCCHFQDAEQCTCSCCCFCCRRYCCWRPCRKLRY